MKRKFLSNMKARQIFFLHSTFTTTKKRANFPNGHSLFVFPIYFKKTLFDEKQLFFSLVFESQNLTKKNKLFLRPKAAQAQYGVQGYNLK